MMDAIPSAEGGQKIAVAMSGGVDSAVTAALMHQAGHKVFGIYMRNWRDDDRTPECATMQDWVDARKVCDKLDIDLEVVEFSDIYKEKVFIPFLQGLRQGYTPNPDVMCNHHIKFQALTEYAKTLGASGLATGHYARLVLTNEGAHLYCARDKDKCQTYFLFAAGSFNDCIMPLGALRKKEVRAIASKLGLHNHAKKDSTGLCFIGERNFSQFIARYIPDEPGKIKDVDGNLLGQHRGLFHYTLGQRRGLGIGGVRTQTQIKETKENPPPETEADTAWYVVDKMPQENVLVVAQGGKHPSLYAKGLTLEDIAWVGQPSRLPLRCRVKTRYRMESVMCHLSQAEDGTTILIFDHPQRAVTPGQAAVLYAGERCLGGGFIRQALNDEVATKLKNCA